MFRLSVQKIISNDLKGYNVGEGRQPLFPVFGQCIKTMRLWPWVSQTLSCSVSSERQDVFLRNTGSPLEEFSSDCVSRKATSKVAAPQRCSCRQLSWALAWEREGLPWAQLKWGAETAAQGPCQGGGEWGPDATPFLREGSSAGPHREPLTGEPGLWSSWAGEGRSGRAQMSEEGRALGPRRGPV